VRWLYALVLFIAALCIVKIAYYVTGGYLGYAVLQVLEMAGSGWLAVLSAVGVLCLLFVGWNFAILLGLSEPLLGDMPIKLPGVEFIGYLTFLHVLVLFHELSAYYSLAIVSGLARMLLYGFAILVIALPLCSPYARGSLVLSARLLRKWRGLFLVFPTLCYLFGVDVFVMITLLLAATGLAPLPTWTPFPLALGIGVALGLLLYLRWSIPGKLPEDAAMLPGTGKKPHAPTKHSLPAPPIAFFTLPTGREVLAPLIDGRVLLLTLEDGRVVCRLLAALPCDLALSAVYAPPETLAVFVRKTGHNYCVFLRVEERCLIADSKQHLALVPIPRTVSEEAGEGVFVFGRRATVLDFTVQPSAVTYPTSSALRLHDLWLVASFLKTCMLAESIHPIAPCFPLTFVDTISVADLLVSASPLAARIEVYDHDFDAIDLIKIPHPPTLPLLSLNHKVVVATWSGCTYTVDVASQRKLRRVLRLSHLPLHHPVKVNDYQCLIASFDGRLCLLSSTRVLWVRKIPEYIPVPPLVQERSETCVVLGRSSVFLLKLTSGAVLEQAPHKLPLPRLATVLGENLLVYCSNGQMITLPLPI